MMFRYFFSFVLISSFLQLNAQEADSLVKKEQIELKKEDIKEKKVSLFADSSKLQSARSAIYRSAIIPGWGQARNGKWWKVPLVYGGFVGIGLVYEFNQRYYKEFLGESQFRKANPGQTNLPEYAKATDQQIFNTKDYYRRSRDLALFSFIGFYGLNIIDAYIDARLATFDVGDNLSIKIEPSIYVPMYALDYRYAPVPMLKLNIKL